MKIVIDIDDELYKSVINNDDYVLEEDVDWILLENAIANGTPLPEHHGRLIDADALYDSAKLCHTEEDGTACVEWREINDAPTVIEGSESE